MEQRPWFKSYDPQVPHSLEPYPKIPLFGFLEQAARDYADRTAVIFKPRAMNGALDSLTGGKIELRLGTGQEAFLPDLSSHTYGHGEKQVETRRAHS